MAKQTNWRDTAVSRHNEIKEFMAQKIYKDLGITQP